MVLELGNTPKPRAQPPLKTVQKFVRVPSKCDHENCISTFSTTAVVAILKLKIFITFLSCSAPVHTHTTMRAMRTMASSRVYEVSVYWCSSSFGLSLPDSGSDRGAIFTRRWGLPHLCRLQSSSPSPVLTTAGSFV